MRDSLFLAFVNSDSTESRDLKIARQLAKRGRSVGGVLSAGAKGPKHANKSI